MRGFFEDDGFLRGIVQATIPRKLESMTEEVVFGSEKRTVVVNLPCIEKPTVYYGKKIETAEDRCYTSAKLTSVFTSHTVPIKLVKDALLRYPQTT